jgi:hypothetical protein
MQTILLPPNDHDTRGPHREASQVSPTVTKALYEIFQALRAVLGPWQLTPR